MKTFGRFRSGNEFFYGELCGDEVHRLSQPYWIEVQPTGEVLPVANLKIDVPVAPSKLIAVGLNYADHIAEMKRYSNRGAINLVQGAEFAAGTSRRNRNSVSRAQDRF